jgi:hypothetical protein
MGHAHCMLDTSGYKPTLIIYNTYCCSTATMVKRTPLCVTLYVRCLSCNRDGVCLVLAGIRYYYYYYY